MCKTKFTHENYSYYCEKFCSAACEQAGRAFTIAPKQCVECGKTVTGSDSFPFNPFDLDAHKKSWCSDHWKQCFAYLEQHKAKRLAQEEWERNAPIRAKEEEKRRMAAEKEQERLDRMRRQEERDEERRQDRARQERERREREIERREKLEQSELDREERKRRQAADEAWREENRARIERERAEKEAERREKEEEKARKIAEEEAAQRAEDDKWKPKPFKLRP
jgi:hypothetical protein